MLRSTSDLDSTYRKAVRGLNAEADALPAILPDIAARPPGSLLDACRQFGALPAADARAKAILADAKRKANERLRAIEAEALAAADAAKQAREIAQWAIHGQAYPSNVAADLAAAAIVIRATLTGEDAQAKDQARAAALDLSRAALAAEEHLRELAAHCRKNRYALSVARAKAHAGWLDRQSRASADPAQAKALAADANRITRRAKALTTAYRAKYLGGAK